MLIFQSYLMLVLCITSQTTGQEVIKANSQNHTRQCNQICNYVEWARDANCQHCYLTKIPDECSQAVMLDLGHNNINHIPCGAFKSFRNLFYIDLEGNGVIEIDDDAFNGNYKTRYVYLHRNQLQTIKNGTFTGVPHLLQLYLNKNRIHTVDDGAFSGLVVLETLYLSENNLTQISGFLDKLTKLRYFHMTHNHLTCLKNSTFHSLENLRYLDLIHNKIETVDADAFRGLVSLRVLKLAYNRITSIGQHAFLHMRHLIHLNLYDNKISTTSNFTFGIDKLEELYLGLNSLTCDCQIKIVQDWLLEHNDTDCAVDTICGSPADLQGTSVAILKNISSCESNPTTHPYQTWNDITATVHKNLSLVPDRTEQTTNALIIALLVTVPFTFLAITMIIIYIIVKRYHLCDSKLTSESQPELV